MTFSSVLLSMMLLISMNTYGNELSSTLIRAKNLFPVIPPTLNEREKQMAYLGRRLFFDKRISINGEVSCASCHRPEKYFTDGLKTANTLAKGNRNTPTIINSFSLTWNFWDGRADSLASQAVKPMEDPGEHGANRVQVYRLVESEYKREYEALWGNFPKIKSEIKNGLPKGGALQLLAEIRSVIDRQMARFPNTQKSGQSLAAKSGPIDLVSERWRKDYSKLVEQDKKAVNKVFAKVGLAIANFERTIISNDSPFDRFMSRWQAPKDFKTAFNRKFGAKEFLGLQIFTGKAQCINCHHGPQFTDQQFHNVGVPNPNFDLGRARGLAALKGDEFSCESPNLKEAQWITSSEACAEKNYLNMALGDHIAAFKTPSLRNVAQTAPYGHNGSLASLRAVIDNYHNPQKGIGHRSESLPKLRLSDSEKDALEAFLRSLTGGYTHL